MSLGLPDGMTVDSEGFIWSAIWHSAMVIRFDPEGVEERRINLPAAQSSSVMFGGENLNELYITSASITDPTGVSLKDMTITYIEEVTSIELSWIYKEKMNLLQTLTFRGEK